MHFHPLVIAHHTLHAIFPLVMFVNKACIKILTLETGSLAVSVCHCCTSVWSLVSLSLIVSSKESYRHYAVALKLLTLFMVVINTSMSVPFFYRYCPALFSLHVKQVTVLQMILALLQLVCT